MDIANSNVRGLFPQVLANGFIPIPNFDKRCMLKRWPSIKVDQRQVELWARQKRWPAIGVRVEPPLIVVDIDVLDAELTAEIERMLPIGSLRRIGKAPKAAHFLRYDGEPFFRIATRRWAPDITVEKPAWSAVEIFAGGGGGKQFGILGPHKRAESDGAVLSTYDWPDGRSPANTALASLPVLSYEDVLRIVDTSERLFAGKGFSVDQFTKGGEHQVDNVFDLTADMTFVGDGENYDLAGLENSARAAMVKGGQIRITGSFTGDPFSGGSLRCRVGISHYGRVYIHDFKMGLTHHPVDAAAGHSGGVEGETLSDIFKLIGAVE